MHRLFTYTRNHVLITRYYLERIGNICSIPGAANAVLFAGNAGYGGGAGGVNVFQKFTRITDLETPNAVYPSLLHMVAKHSNKIHQLIPFENVANYIRLKNVDTYSFSAKIYRNRGMTGLKSYLNGSNLSHMVKDR